MIKLWYFQDHFDASPEPEPEGIYVTDCWQANNFKQESSQEYKTHFPNLHSPALKQSPLSHHHHNRAKKKPNPSSSSPATTHYPPPSSRRGRKPRSPKYNPLDGTPIPPDKKRFKMEQCEICGAISRSLKTHMMTHTNEKKFECDFCGRKFSLRSSIKNHLFGHINIR